MKKVFQICSIFLSSLILFSCSNSINRKGSVSFSLPKSVAAVDRDDLPRDLSSEEMKLAYDINIYNSPYQSISTPVYFVEKIESKTQSVELDEGDYVVQITAYISEENETTEEKEYYVEYKGNAPFTIKPGETVSVSVTMSAVTIPESGIDDDITDTDLMIDVSGEDDITLKVFSASGKEYSSYQWIVNGEVIEEENDFFEVDSSQLSFNKDNLIAIYAGQTIKITCVVDDKYDITYEVDIEA